MATTSSVNPSQTADSPVAGIRPSSEKHQSPDRAHVGRQRTAAVGHVHPLQQLVQGHAGVDEPARIVAGDDLLLTLGAVLVVDLADQFFQHVFHRHQALRAAELVQHDRHLRAASAGSVPSSLSIRSDSGTSNAGRTSFRNSIGQPMCCRKRRSLV